MRLTEVTWLTHGLWATILSSESLRSNHTLEPGSKRNTMSLNLCFSHYTVLPQSSYFWEGKCLRRPHLSLNLLQNEQEKQKKQNQNQNKNKNKTKTKPNQNKPNQNKTKQKIPKKPITLQKVKMFSRPESNYQGILNPSIAGLVLLWLLWTSFIMYKQTLTVLTIQS